MTGRELLKILQSLPDHRLDLDIMIEKGCYSCGSEIDAHIRNVEVSIPTYTIWLED